MKEYADKYMDQYTGGKGGSAGYEKYYQKYMQTSGGASQDNSAINLQSQDSNGGYEKYMKQYAGGSSGGGGYEKYMKQYAGGSNGGYEKYMKQYAGGSNGGYEKYMKQYAGGSQGSSGSFDYQKYMNMDYKKLQQTQTNLNTIYSPQQAKTKEELDSWKDAQYKNLGQFVPSAYQHYADSTVEQQYQQRLVELQNSTTGTTDDTEATSPDSDKLSKLEADIQDIKDGPSVTEETAQEASGSTATQNLIETAPRVSSVEASGSTAVQNLIEQHESSTQLEGGRKLEEASESGSKFLAQKVENTGSNAKLALALVACAAVASAPFLLFAKFTKRVVEIPAGLDPILWNLKLSSSSNWNRRRVPTSSAWGSS